MSGMMDGGDDKGITPVSRSEHVEHYPVVSEGRGETAARTGAKTKAVHNVSLTITWRIHLPRHRLTAF